MRVTEYSIVKVLALWASPFSRVDLVLAELLGVVNGRVAGDDVTFSSV